MIESELYRKLIEYRDSDFYGFHMPGHKRAADKISMENPYSFDLTEIDGFDNMHNPSGIIFDEMNKAKMLYGSDKSYFLVNGSSSGNLASIAAVADEGDTVIICRNVHKSVYNAAELRKLNIVYVYPDLVEGQMFFGGVNPESIRQAFKKHPNAKAVILTSPTYEGIVSDIASIAEIAHENKAVLIVDSAHGAHFILGRLCEQEGKNLRKYNFPKSALDMGADISIESLHKTLPSLTQTAILHYREGCIDQEKLEKYLRVFQTSSPSYVFMASICNCLAWVKTGTALCVDWIERLQNFRKKARCFSSIQIYEGEDQFAYDLSKLVIIIKSNSKYSRDKDGIWLSNVLRSKYHLEMEMCSGNYVLAMTSAFDSDEAMNRLFLALQEIDVSLSENYGERDMRYDCEEGYNHNEDDRWSEKNINCKNENLTASSLDKIYGIRNNKICEIHEVEKCKESGVSKNYVYLYPPGIPLVVPGEIVDSELKGLIKEYKQRGFKIEESL